MVASDMARLGPVVGAWAVAQFNMAAGTIQPTGFNRLGAVEACKVTTRLASGVTGLMVMEQ